MEKRIQERIEVIDAQILGRSDTLKRVKEAIAKANEQIKQLEIEWNKIALDIEKLKSAKSELESLLKSSNPLQPVSNAGPEDGHTS